MLTSTTDIARLTGLHLTTILRRARRMGLKPTKRYGTTKLWSARDADRLGTPIRKFNGRKRA